MLQPLFQTHILDREDFLAPFLPVLAVIRNKRSRIDKTRKLCLLFVQMETYLCVNRVGPGEKCGHPSPLPHNSGNVQIRVNGLILKTSGTAQNLPVFRNQIMAAKHQILGGFSLSRIGVNISADQPGRLPADQRFPVRVFSRGFIAGGTVDDYGRSGKGMVDARRVRHPYILTDLRRHCQSRHLLTGKQKPCSKGNIIPFSISGIRPDSIRFLVSPGKMPELIEFPVVGNAGLWHQAKQLSSLKDRSHIVKLSFLFPGKPRENQSVQFPGLPDNLQKSFLCALQKQLLQKQIPAGIACDAKLRKYNNLCPIPRGLFRKTDNFPGIPFRVRHLYLRRHSRRFNKSVYHTIPSPEAGIFSPFLINPLPVRFYRFAFARILFKSSTSKVYARSQN